MKLNLFCVTLFLLGISANCFAQKFVDAKDLTMINKIGETPNYYERVDVSRYDLNKTESNLLRMPSSEALVFRTNSKKLWIRTEYENYFVSTNSTQYATSGYDLYIKRDGKWLWAAAGVSKEKDLKLIEDMDGSMHECLLYLPLYAHISKVEIGVDEEATIDAIPNPFHHRILIIGSSFTHGAACSRAGMSYPMILERYTGVQFVGVAVSGNSKLQPFWAEIIRDGGKFDAVVIDGFSNPSADLIRKRTHAMIEEIRAVDPELPLIFLRTIYRERRNFNTATEEFEAAKMVAMDEVMKEAVKKYNKIYYIDTPNQTGIDHETSVDGIHPGDFGYWRWAHALLKPLTKIFRKEGIL